MDEMDFIERVLIDRAKNIPLNEAVEAMIQFAPEKKDLVEQAANKIRQAAEKIRTMREPRTFGQGGEPWYVGPTDNDVVWPAYRKLLEERGWTTDDILRVDRASNKILSLMQPPGVGAIDTRGLVIGYVQSGKTANYTGLIAKAADVGYRFFVVLTGIIESLRRQTQDRLERDLIGRVAQHWVQVTSQQSDFHEHLNVNAFLADHANQYTIAVVKKNGPILRRLLQWLSGAQQEILRNCPVLIIDAEADLASINTARGELRTTINRLILNTLSALPKAAYVGFTATPFANVLIDPTDRDLYPKDFIVDLERPAGYFGAEKLFGRDRLNPEESDDVTDGLDMIRTVSDEEIASLRPSGAQQRHSFRPEMTSSLREACSYFWMATAARKVRGQTAEHSTMLVHTTIYASTHEAFREPFSTLKNEILSGLGAGNRSIIAALREIWEREQPKVPPQGPAEGPISFADLLSHLAPVIDSTEFKVENSFSIERLDYSNPGRIYIVVGGNVIIHDGPIDGQLRYFKLDGVFLLWSPDLYVRWEKHPIEFPIFVVQHVGDDRPVFVIQDLLVWLQISSVKHGLAR